MTIDGTDPVLTSVRYSRTNLGTSRIDVYEGSAVGLNTILQTIATWQQWDWDDSDAPRYRLTVRTPEPGSGDAVGTSPASAAYEWSWELVGSEVNVDIKQHPRTLWASDTPSGQEVLKIIVNAADDPDNTLSSTPEGPATNLPTDKFNVLMTLYDLLVKGQNSFQWPGYSIRISLVVGPNFTGGTSDDGECQVWSAGGILGYYSNYPPTQRIATRMQNLQAYNPYSLFNVPASDIAGYTWGWLAGPTTESELPDKRVRVQREFKLDHWNTAYTYTIFR